MKQFPMGFGGRGRERNPPRPPLILSLRASLVGRRPTVTLPMPQNLKNPEDRLSHLGSDSSPEGLQSPSWGGGEGSQQSPHPPPRASLPSRRPRSERGSVQRRPGLPPALQPEQPLGAAGAGRTNNGETRWGRKSVTHRPLASQRRHGNGTGRGGPGGPALRVQRARRSLWRLAGRGGP